MVKKLFHSFIPASLYRSRTAFPVLSRADQELQQCQHTTEAIDILRRTKPELCARLRPAFPSPLAEALTLKVLNLFLARYHFRARSVSLLSRPFGLIVDPSNVCQLACPGCVHSERSEAFAAIRLAERHAFGKPLLRAAEALRSLRDWNAFLQLRGASAQPQYAQADSDGQIVADENDDFDDSIGPPIRRRSVRRIRARFHGSFRSMARRSPFTSATDAMETWSWFSTIFESWWTRSAGWASAIPHLRGTSWRLNIMSTRFLWRLAWREASASIYSALSSPST